MQEIKIDLIPGQSLKSMEFKCSMCSKTFSRNDNLVRHVRTCHNKSSLQPPPPISIQSSSQEEIIDPILSPPPQFQDANHIQESRKIMSDAKLMDALLEPWPEAEWDQCHDPSDSVAWEELDSADPNRLAADFIDECYRTNYCVLCDEKFGVNPEDLDFHLIQNHAEYYDEVQVQRGYGIGEEISIKIKEQSSAHNRVQVKYGAENLDNLQVSDLNVLFKNTEAQVKSVIKTELSTRKNIKVFMNLKCLLIDDKSGEEHVAGFTTFAHSLLRPGQIPWLWIALTSKLERRLEDYTRLKTGLRLEKILKFQFTIATYRPLFGGKFMNLPYPLSLKTKTFVNIRNSATLDEMQNKCFLWSVLAHNELGGSKFEQDHNRVRRNSDPLSYVREKVRYGINDDGIRYPMTLEQISKFEKQNPQIAITVLGYESQGEKKGMMKGKSVKAREKAIYDIIRRNCFLLYNTKQRRPIQVDLLLLMSDQNQHFVLIKNLSNLLKNPQSHHAPRQICRNCLQGFCTLESLEKHNEFCAELGLQQTSFPKKDYLEFDKFARTQKTAFRFYADFESFLVPHLETDPNGIKSNEEEPATKKILDHVCSGYAWICVDYLDRVRYHHVYRISDRNENVAALLVRDISNCRTILAQEIDRFQAQSDKNMVISEEEQEFAKQSGICGFCKKSLEEPFQSSSDDDDDEPFGWQNEKETDHPVRHHEHLPPFKFQFYAHNSCNLKARLSKNFPVFFHNGANYDIHYIVQAIPTLMEMRMVEDVDVIPNSTEKFLAVTLNKDIVFLDSIRFTMASLERLVDSLAKDKNEKFDIVKQVFGGKGNCDLLLKKGAYPYTYMDSIKKFEERSLPPSEVFYNDMTEEPIDENVYQNTLKVWESFKVQNMGQWQDLYCLLDVALLASVIERTRKILYNKYELEMTHYFSLPMVSFDASLKLSGVKLDYIKDSTMYCFIENSIRGGYCAPGALRAAIANNPYMQDEYNENEPISYIEYVDATNLYGSAMSEYLPTGDFCWIDDPDELESVLAEVFLLPKDSPHGYFVQVDIQIPHEMHDYLNELPPGMMKRCVDEEELSTAYQMPMKDNLKVGKSFCKTPKLIADLYDKFKYPVHYRLLQLFLCLKCPKTGSQMSVTKVHVAVQFNQSPWLKKYIDTNTEMRNKAESEFERDFWKLITNSTYGKMIEQVRKRQNVNIVYHEAQAIKLLKKPTVQSIINIHENMSIYLMKKLNVQLNKPIIVGACILELSKCTMYDMHYNCVKAFYHDKARLMYMDTDSLIYHVETQDLYKDNQRNSLWFDNSKYDPQNPIFGHFHNNENKDVLGKFKDEYANCVITELVAPRPKMYALRAIKMASGNVKTPSGKWKMDAMESKRAKGIGKVIIKKHTKVEEYWNAIRNGEQSFKLMRVIRRRKHRIYTEILRKRAINALCNKRWALSSIYSLAHGHKDIKMYEAQRRHSGYYNVNIIESDKLCMKYLELKT